MSVKINGKDKEVPREIVAGGPKAIDEWIKSKSSAGSSPKKASKGKGD